jgi:hypothetical protein
MKHTKYPHSVNSKPAPTNTTSPKPQPTRATPPARQEVADAFRRQQSPAPVTAAETFVKAVQKSVSPRAVAIISLELPEDVAAVLQESFWGISELGRALGEICTACQLGEVDKAAAVMKALPEVMQGAERTLLGVAAHHGVDMGEVVGAMQRVNAALYAAWQADTEPGHLRLV